MVFDPSVSITPSWGWIVLGGYILWQIYASKLGYNTRFQEIVNSVNERIEKVGERIDDVEERQEQLVAVTQIIAVETETVDGDGVKHIFGNKNIDDDRVYADGEGDGQRYTDERRENVDKE